MTTVRTHVDGANKISFAVLFAIRTRIEEQALIAGLPGYADYRNHVRYRLVPGLW